MQDIFNKYLDYLRAEKNASRYTVRNYEADLRDFFGYVHSQGITSLKEIDKQAIRSYLTSLVERDMAKSSMSRKLSAIRSFYRYLRREEIIKESPVENIASPKLDKRLPTFLTGDEAKKLVESPDLSKPEGQRDRALLEMLYASGMRVSELVSLNIEQVNLENREIRVWGKGSKERIVLIGEPAAAALVGYLNSGRPRLLGNKPNTAVFLGRYGGRLPVRTVEKILAKYARSVGKRVHPHMLRHTFATHMLDGGADLRVVQELLGHATLSSTQVYTHVTKSQARKVYLSAHPMARQNEDN
ncbi:MAG: tyrosine recombinase XerC [Dehalococcoidales bacterium]|nr:tyrosine recombinase XerC [Dehalococcoidales bacterium]